MDPQEIWRRKSDDEVVTAVATLDEFTEEGQRIILSELQRRGIPEAAPMTAIADRASGRPRVPLVIRLYGVIYVAISGLSLVGLLLQVITSGLDLRTALAGMASFLSLTVGLGLLSGNRFAVALAATPAVIGLVFGVVALVGADLGGLFILFLAALFLPILVSGYRHWEVLHW